MKQSVAYGYNKCKDKPNDDVHCYKSIYDSPKLVEFAQSSKENIVKLSIKENTNSKRKSTYYAYWNEEEGKFNHVFPTETLVRMCFPDFAEEHEKRGEGRVMNVILEEINEC